MTVKHKFAFFFLLAIAALLAAFLYPYGVDSAVLDPRGMIGLKERNLIIVSTLLMLIVVIPVLLLAFFICLRYRASNKSARYNPYWDHSILAESIWWGFPCVIILVLSVITWQSSHELDPYKPIKTHVDPLKIQVVALQWKWLFIYPEQKIATVNFFQFPEKTPLEFEITADAPMNSFWIPQLGGQIYAMPGMRTNLHLIADEEGSFRGSSANLSGEGFAGMTFIAKASSRDDFDQWVESVRQSPQPLGRDEYHLLARPSSYDPEAFYALQDEGLYDYIVMKYMQPMPHRQEMDTQTVSERASVNQEIRDLN